ncbi:OB-fold nucleic acid binding domain-containing protein, partial [Kineococcus indalonis]|uniref:OB-fold nucleic acid binding domain-containing protein n=1 Tax=Kineococcus indalonis TaxID=2696566 RepID=UPI002B1BE3A3
QGVGPGVDVRAAARRQVRTRAPGAGPAGDGAAVQLALDLGDGAEEPVASGLPELGASQRVRAELEVLGLDVSAHVVTAYVPLLRALGVTPARELLHRRNGAELLVAGVKVATQTPPVRSGRRVVFLTLDDSTGPADAAFFEDAQDPWAATVFHSWLLLVRGVLRRTGPRGVSLRATGAWELTQLHRLWSAHGEPAVRALLDAAPARRADPPPRVLVHPSGFRQSPYADLRPPGEDVRATRPAARGAAPRRLWSSSPGSSGW